MNNKSRIFIAAHDKIFKSFSNLDQHEGKNEGTEISRVFLEISHLYLTSVTNADESDYWMSFVFDTCCSSGLCSIRYIDHLSIDQKRNHIQATLIDRLKDAGKGPLEVNSIVRHISALVKSQKDTAAPNDAKEREIASVILDYIHVLVSIDRTISEKENVFFKSIRDGVYKNVGWRKEGSLHIAGDGRQTGNPRNNANTDESPAKSVEEILEELRSLIGLENIKIEVQSLVNSLQVQQMRKQAGLPNADISNHMIFYGNPGTGKTTIARKLGHLYYQLGILSKGHFIETDRSGLVGGYLGQTAIKTKDVLDSALGGILFIDEAYSLSSATGEDQYGQEAIDTILKYMEDHRDDLIIIAAGYENLMGEFLRSNPGLKSRFNKFFRFEDYSEDELLKIFILIANQSSYALDDDAKEHLGIITKEMIRTKSGNFGNGRTIRNLFERSIANQANRIVALSTSDKIDLQRIAKEDIQWQDVAVVTN